MIKIFFRLILVFQNKTKRVMKLWDLAHSMFDEHRLIARHNIFLKFTRRWVSETQEIRDLFMDSFKPLYKKIEWWCSMECDIDFALYNFKKGGEQN